MLMVSASSGRQTSGACRRNAVNGVVNRLKVSIASDSQRSTIARPAGVRLLFREIFLVTKKYADVCSL